MTAKELDGVTVKTRLRGTIYHIHLKGKKLIIKWKAEDGHMTDDSTTYLLSEINYHISRGNWIIINPKSKENYPIY
jgi:hypothetical protein